MATMRGYGVSVDLPAGCDGRITRRPVDPMSLAVRAGGVPLRRARQPRRQGRAGARGRPAARIRRHRAAATAGRVDGVILAGPFVAFSGLLAAAGMAKLRAASIWSRLLGSAEVAV